ncbi:MAG: hypothetical protein DI536_30935 [Archangium gephyra]|uniref:Uncharacterized protein n=1 Tax=Archangium gephyra TaxID=48 RepID=A0A2W5SZG1_9BACT|nr:MAG: hypothetical protein DI536_30935 [Archangium gephyra]
MQRLLHCGRVGQHALLSTQNRRSLLSGLKTNWPIPGTDSPGAELETPLRERLDAGRIDGAHLDVHPRSLASELVNPTVEEDHLRVVRRDDAEGSTYAPRPFDQALIAMGESMVALGVVRSPR